MPWEPSGMSAALRRTGRTTIERDYQMIVAAAINGERCPQNAPHGPLNDGSITALVAEGRIRSEVYRLNFRRVTILKGEHAGRSTAPHPEGRQPWKIDGRPVDRGQHSGWSDRRTPAPVTLPKLGKIAP